ncbi:MAG: thiolase domain-containing protein [Anaerolineales bacterium]|nr:thiolase domain-containing protein [Anaerolineales bacterium]MCS7247100.1 thiolase domain-containing protein [Anaerolineales bacterium]MDW8160911.1 thiolase domain-containing protein [Anaerolineales bacterium]MDW8447063.1 thiolase domain-containing protein [Anaerolineales bacterium]
MREVAIVGIGMTPVDEHWDKSIRELAAEAVLLALEDAQRESVDALFVGNMLSGLISQQENLGALVADWTGLRYTEAIKVEAACSSGAAAVRQALIAVASGYIDSAIAVGVEKMTEARGSEVTAALATAADADYEVAHGVSFVALNALIMQRYMHEYGWQHAHFAPFSINAHANALTNPYARLREKIDEQDYAKAKMIAYPINLLDASPIGDGAAAVLLVPRETLRKNGKPIIKIAGSAAATDSIAIHDRKDPLWLRAAEISAKKAFSQAGVGPKEIDFFELHDAFSIMSALSLEACGFAQRGQGPRLALEGQITLKGKLPITTMGGLKARGHPVGATGVYQIVEAVLQLRGAAGENQVPDAKIGMTQNIGGSGSNIITHILVRE